MSTERRRGTALFAIVAGSALALGVAAVQAATVSRIAGNDTLATAQNLDGAFSLEFDNNITIEDGRNFSTVASHASVSAVGDDTYHYYSFNVTQDGATGIFDIDGGMPDVDTEIALFDAAGNALTEDDDSFKPQPSGSFEPVAIDDGHGSVHGYDSFIRYVFATQGTYFVGVARFPSQSTTGGWDLGVRQVEDSVCDDTGCVPTGTSHEEPNSVPVQSGADYVLNISIGDLPEPLPAPVPVPGSAPLLAAAVLLTARFARRRAAR